MDRDYRGREHSVRAPDVVDADLEAVRSAHVLLAHPWKPSAGTAIETWEAGRAGVNIVIWADTVTPWLRYYPATIVRTIYEVESRLQYVAAVMR